MIMKRRNSTLPVVWIDSGLHSFPNKLNKHIQDTLDQLPGHYTTVLLLFGFCGNSMVGIQSRNRTLVLPYVSDCMPIFLGSQKNREEAGNDTYFFTEGYLSGEQNALTDLAYSRNKYGEDTATYITKTMMAHYKRLAIIDTGTFNIEEVRKRIFPLSELIELPITVVPGNLSIIEDLLDGRWNPSQFLVKPPGEEITFADALKAGKSQIL